MTIRMSLGSSLLMALLVAPLSAHAAGLASLESGTPGDPTREVQGSLERLGFRPGPIDGIFGPRTRSAVMTFQAATELRPTGILDIRTREKLREVLVTLAESANRTPWSAVLVSEDGKDEATVSEIFGVASTEVQRVRLAAVEVLGELRTARARATLGIVLYANTVASVRAAAAKELGAFGDAESLYTLALALESEPDADVRNVIAREIEKNLPVELPPRLDSLAKR